MVTYILGQVAIAVFAITGVLAASRKDRDMFGLVVLGVLTALGGGTLRDITLNVPVFWLEDFTYGWVALATAVAAFLVYRFLRNTYRLLLYLDAVGVALFGIQAIDKTLGLGYNAPIAIIMGVLTGIGGGIIRDVLSGQPNLLITKELYATPILLGCILYTFLLHLFPNFAFSRLLALVVIFGFRAVAIHWNMAMPNWLTSQRNVN
jgi:uncharacterized membrane protein YeiH